MSKFHIGEKVKCTDNLIDNVFDYHCKGRVGTVVEVCDGGIVAVEFDDYGLYLPDNVLISIDAKYDTSYEQGVITYSPTTETNYIKDKSEFTDEEILDSLYACRRTECVAGCSLKEQDNCMSYLLTLAIELIQRQQKKISSVEKEDENLRSTIKDICNAIPSLFFTDDAKSYKVFAEKVANALVDNNSEEFVHWINNDSKINAILKELIKAITPATAPALSEQQERKEKI